MGKESYVLIGGHKFYHGDMVKFKPYHDEEDNEECVGRISIPEDASEQVLRFHVCQNHYDGEQIDDTLGFEYSWVVNVSIDGDIISTDTDYIYPVPIESKPCFPCDTSKISLKESETFSTFDDDIMPDDWEFDLTQLKKELDENP